MWELLSENQLKQYEESGFVLGNRLLSDEKARDLMNIIEDIITNEDNPYHKRVYNFKHGGTPLLHIKNMWKRYEEFTEIYQNKELIQTLYQLTGVKRFHLWQDRFYYKPANSGGFHTWHQDAAYHPFLRPYTQINAWIALNDTDAENGAMTMVVGSHKWGEAFEFMDEVSMYAKDGQPLPEKYLDKKVKVVVSQVPAGFVHFHDALTWHCSGPNWSSRPRCAIGLHLVAADVRFDANHKYAKDYDGIHGENLDPSLYPLVELE